MVGFQVVGGSRGSDCRFLPSFLVLFFFCLFLQQLLVVRLFSCFLCDPGFPLLSFTSFRISFFSAQIKQRRSISSRSCPPNGWRTATSIRQPRYIQLSNICTNELRTTHCILKIESLRPLWHLVHHRRHDLASAPYGISNR